MRISPAEIEAQRAFRVLLAAMSRPGKLYHLTSPQFSEGPLPVLAPLFGGLLDHEVSVAVLGDGPFGKLAGHIAARTRCRTAPVAEADFIFIAGGDSRGAVLCAKRGTLHYPDRSAILVYQVPSLLSIDEAPVRLALTGPGIREEIRLGAISGLAPHEPVQLKEANREFPLGVDALFIDEYGRLLCLPRSTQIRILEG
jgi:alpha-D-ribose 1-methylphosphonate 5-triphosphate synthase subunit PhnH